MSLQQRYKIKHSKDTVLDNETSEKACLHPPSSSSLIREFLRSISVLKINITEAIIF